ncbi:MAG: type II secretion system protein GspL [Kangiellaceae bacterium]|nr:type II secretion system protein GspL [Kangiellaceae bacterium]
MTKLTIFWGERSDSTFYWYVDKPQEITSKAIPLLEEHEILKADLACLADIAMHSQVELVLPFNDVHFNQVELPNKAQRHLRKAVPFLLEEQLAESVDDVFIAVGERNKSGQTPVRAIELEYMNEIDAAFKEAEISLKKISIDLDNVDLNAEAATVVLIGEQVLFVDQENSRWGCNKLDFPWLIQKHLINDDEEDLPVAIPLNVVAKEALDFQLFEQSLPAGRFAANEVLIDSAYQYLAETKEESINLLQGDFEPKVENSPLRRLITKAAVIFAIVFTANLLYQGSMVFTLSAQAENLDSHKEVLWKQIFPRRKMPKNANRQIRSRIKALSGGKGDDAFLVMLESVTEKITDLSKLYPTNISYDASRNELRLDLIGNEYETLNAYRDTLTQAGFQVDMNSATERGEGYSSRFIVKK